jgi:sec-independent protein translocase protein TatB
MLSIEGAFGTVVHLAFIVDSFGTGEMIAILLLAMIVVGPERLPQTARQIGHAVARLRRSLREMTAEVQDIVDDPAMAPIRELGEFATRPRQKFSEILRDAERSLDEQEAANATRVDGEEVVEVDVDGQFKPVSPGGPGTIAIEQKPAPRELSSPELPGSASTADEGAPGVPPSIDAAATTEASVAAAPDSESESESSAPAGAELNETVPDVPESPESPDGPDSRETRSPEPSSAIEGPENLPGTR